MDEQRMREIATEVYQKLGTQYNVPQVPRHLHNVIDSPNLPPSSLTPFIALPATTGGVLSPSNISGRSVSNPISGNVNFSQTPPTVFVAPIPLIAGTAATTFQGGLAPGGSLISYSNATKNQLIWRGYDPGTGLYKWFGVDYTIGPF